MAFGQDIACRRLPFLPGGYPRSRKIFPKSQCVKGAAANMFQKKAIGKFLISVPIQTAGSFVTGIPPIMILKIKKRAAFNWIYAVECHTSDIILYDSD